MRRESQEWPLSESLFLLQLSQWNFQAEPEAPTLPHNPVTFLRTNSLISLPVKLGSPITGSTANLLDENNDEAVLSYKCGAFLL